VRSVVGWAVQWVSHMFGHGVWLKTVPEQVKTHMESITEWERRGRVRKEDGFRAGQMRRGGGQQFECFSRRLSGTGAVGVRAG